LAVAEMDARSSTAAPCRIAVERIELDQ